MADWLKLLQDNNLFRNAQPAKTEAIIITENELDLAFAQDYNAFLSSVGACICFNHEINGITDYPNLNVVRSTREARKNLPLFPYACYAIEELHMDGIIICQDRSGSVYQISPAISLTKIADSLEAYVTGTIADQISEKIQISDQSGIKDPKLQKQTSARLKDSIKEAETVISNPDKVENALQQMEKKLGKIPGIGDWLADVPAVISLIRSYNRKEYTDIPIASILLAFGAILYVISPVDIIPDYIPVVGMLDDAAVFAGCWKVIHNDVEKYQKWRSVNGKAL